MDECPCMRPSACRWFEMIVNELAAVAGVARHPRGCVCGARQGWRTIQAAALGGRDD